MCRRDGAPGRPQPGSSLQAGFIGLLIFLHHLGLQTLFTSSVLKAEKCSQIVITLLLQSLKPRTTGPRALPTSAVFPSSARHHSFSAGFAMQEQMETVQRDCFSSLSPSHWHLFLLSITRSCSLVTVSSLGVPEYISRYLQNLLLLSLFEHFCQLIVGLSSPCL